MTIVHRWADQSSLSHREPSPPPRTSLRNRTGGGAVTERSEGKRARSATLTTPPPVPPSPQVRGGGANQRGRPLQLAKCETDIVYRPKREPSDGKPTSTISSRGLIQDVWVRVRACTRSRRTCRHSFCPAAAMRETRWPATNGKVVGAGSLPDRATPGGHSTAVPGSLAAEVQVASQLSLPPSMRASHHLSTRLRHLQRRRDDAQLP